MNFVKIFALFAFLLPLSLVSQESVYCIHGFMRKPSSMQKMAKVFENEGYAVHNWGYPSREKTIEEHAEDLVIDLKATACRLPEEPIHFVTHSMGGIIVRAALNHPECPMEAKRGRAVLLAPPNQGSQFGRSLGKVPLFHKWMGNKAGKQLLTSKDFNYLGPFPETVKVLVISGTFGWNPLASEKNDGKVGFKEACLSTPHRHMSHFSGHSWIMYSDTVVYNALLHINGSGQSTDRHSAHED
jgi:triacylglycerol esterase/lipase EstA (alpha/beta hydrolase family)